MNDTEAKVRQELVYTINLQTHQRDFCLAHLVEWERLRAALPVAIQELHALSLLNSTRTFNSSNNAQVHSLLSAAVTRVYSLRKREVQLEGIDAYGLR
jgi:hypothetical protein